MRDAFTSRPEADQDTALNTLETNYTLLCKDWDEADHEAEYPLKAELDSFRLLIIQLTSEMAGPKTRPDPSSLDTSIGSCCRGERDESNVLG